MKKCLTGIFFVLLTAIGFSQERSPLIAEKDFQNQRKWVDSVYKTLSVEEKFGQLFMVDIFSSDPKAKIDRIKRLITDYHIGGVIFSKGGPGRQAVLNNEFQALAKVPLMIGMDAEWGLAMRLDSTYAYPWNMTLGAIQDNKIVEQIGKRIGEHSKRLGVHINFAPVVDININPANPIIGNRSFGEDKDNVTAKAKAFLTGMQSAGVMGSVKHFPGHGDTDADSHKVLPRIAFSKNRMNDVELYPYLPLIDAGAASVMIGHLNVPVFEPNASVPSSLSYKIVTELLQEQMSFNGLVFTDALNMKGAKGTRKTGETELAAFLAGNDILLIPEDVPKAMTLLLEAYEKGTISEERLAHSVKKILYAKYKVGLNKYKPVNTRFLYEELNTVHDEALYELAMENALTVIKNEKEILPVRHLERKKIAYVRIGDASGEVFLNELKKYAEVTHVKAEYPEDYLERLKDFNYVIIGFHKPNANPWQNFKFTSAEISLIEEIARKNRVVLSVFARPYAVMDLKNTSNIDGIVMSYQNSDWSQKLTAQLIFGARDAKGVLPVSVGSNFPVNTSLESKSVRRLQYGTPEGVGMNSYKLRKIDSLANLGLKQKMYPGAQVLVSRKGRVIYQKNFGYHEYDNKKKVEDSTVYDLASLTKILASVPLLMELVDKKDLSLDTKLSEMLPEFKGSNKQNLTIKELFSHYARLKAWIPFYRYTLNDSKTAISDQYYSNIADKDFNVQVAEDLYLRRTYTDSIFKIIRDSDLLPKLEYKYSDLPYYLLKPYFEKKYDAPMEAIVEDRLYSPMGANHMGYLPLRKFSKDNIPPTEIDRTFRNQKVQGYVHDQGAAMLGGVAGHAGLFSNANDVAKVMQMFLWKGFYGGKRFFNPDVFDQFNNCYYCGKRVRRGVGFDKPQLGTAGPTCGCVSQSSYGHGGFTGTFTWADPEEEIVYVFLSNRTFPDPENRKLIQSDLRSKIQEAIYDAIDF